MTVRLVGAMSLVLLVSLAAFAILMHRHQELVMDELARTVADVGKRTIETMRFGEDGGSWVARSEPGAGPVIERKVTIRTENKGKVEEKAFVFITTPGGESESMVLDLDDIRAERGPGPFMSLRIPKDVSLDHRVTVSAGSPSRAGVARGESSDDIVLPVSTGEYQQLYSRTQRKTLLLFVGVLVAGIVLSASLAARVTRPIRRLDAAIRELSAGNLDVAVEPQGGDEVGRLARAFNDMAGSMRDARARERELVRREKLSALGRLAAGVAHDVRNPLHSIGLTLDHLEEVARPEEPARAREHDRALGIIREEIARLDRLVQNFLRFAKSEGRASGPVEPAALLADTAALVEKEAARRAVAVRVDAAPDLPLLQAEDEALRSAILNLVLNGFEAMPQGGTLTLVARHTESEVVIEVADTGEGIAAEHREQVFDFAYTTRESGSGLGLAMVHQVVVEDHGGRVEIESAVGVGTRVRLHLPTEARA